MKRWLGMVAAVAMAAGLFAQPAARGAAPPAGTGGGTPGGRAAPAKDPAAVLLEKGIYQEETAGDLEGAVKTYLRIVEEAKESRKIAAEAQYRLARCYLKLKKADLAAAALAALARDFPEQKELLAKADQALAAARAGLSQEEVDKIAAEVVAVISTCAETDPRVPKALDGLKGLKDDAVCKSLVKHLDSNQGTIRRAAIYVLYMGPVKDISPAVPALTKLLSHSEGLTRGMAAIALGARKIAGSLAPLSAMTLEDKSGYARRCAAYALGLLGDPQARPVLEKALQDKDSLVGSNATAALAMLGRSRANRLEFRIAPFAPSSGAKPTLEEAELETYKEWLKAGKVGQWWIEPNGSTRVMGPMHHYRWAPIRADANGFDRLIVGEYHGRKYMLVCNAPHEMMAPSSLSMSDGAIKRVSVEKDNSGRPVVGVEFDERGAERFADLTGENLHSALAILVDGEVLSAPIIQSRMGKNAIITGIFSLQEAERLVQSLQAGSTAAAGPVDVGRARAIVEGMRALMAGVYKAMEANAPETALAMLQQEIEQGKELLGVVRGTPAEATVKAGLPMLERIEAALKAKDYPQARKLLDTLDTMGPMLEKGIKQGLDPAGKAGEPVKSPETAAEGWLRLVDEGKYEESWDQAAGFFRKGVTKEQWSSAAKATRAPLGEFVSRKLLSATFTKSLPGAPDGEYVVIQYQSVFEKKKEAVETVTPMKDADGKWRVSGYFVK